LEPEGNVVHDDALPGSAYKEHERVHVLHEVLSCGEGIGESSSKFPDFVAPYSKASLSSKLKADAFRNLGEDASMYKDKTSTRRTKARLGINLRPRVRQKQGFIKRNRAVHI
jgi:hypothetical protein